MEKIRLADIAESLGLSVAAVSYVLNGKEGKVSARTRARVLEMVKKRLPSGTCGSSARTQSFKNDRTDRSRSSRIRRAPLRTRIMPGLFPFFKKKSSKPAAIF
ncbi:LacI family DNA-binding transcriptional regulator [Allobaculum sp. Allo2]|uniref:LacI family DNA-binding transcriptional regulator n=1 Tax=Allobaculum sp. Allo2 TaxID=2853432 RepID=UPI0034629DE9|nr:helix-turn-helix domain-containing protein [Allobaculum sp. Allo2]